MTTAGGFGPSALATPANAVTIVRLLSAPVLFAVVLARPQGWVTLTAWVVLAGSDGADGYLARRHGTTRSGAFLDPLADKFLVLGAMAALVLRDQFWALPVILIAGREAVISAYRWAVAKNGVSVPARPSAKLKTLVQDLAVSLAMVPVAGAAELADPVLWAAVVLTLVTGAQYLLDARRPAHAV